MFCSEALDSVWTVCITRIHNDITEINYPMNIHKSNHLRCFWNDLIQWSCLEAHMVQSMAPKLLGNSAPFSNFCSIFSSCDGGQWEADVVVSSPLHVSSDLRNAPWHCCQVAPAGTWGIPVHGTQTLRSPSLAAEGVRFMRARHRRSFQLLWLMRLHLLMLIANRWQQ